MVDVFLPIVICGMLFIGVPWIILHYITQWKRARGLSVEDENLLDDLHDTARRLDERLATIERIMAVDNPHWRPAAERSPLTERPLPDPEDWRGRA